MRVLLVKPPYARLFQNDVYCTYPLGLMYVATALEARGHEVQIYHDDVSNPTPIPKGGATFSSMRPLPLDDAILNPYRKVLQAFQPEAVGFSYCTADAHTAHRLAWETKQWLPDVRTIAGGVHPSLLPDTIPEYINNVWVGEGDDPEVYTVVERRRSTGMVCHSRPNLQLDQFLPNRGAVIGGERYPSLLRGMVQTQRGCPYACGYCSTPIVFGTKVRLRDPGLVREEVESLGVTEGRVIDDSFAIHRPHGLAICRELEKVNYRWVCDIALQNVDDELLDALAKAGCTAINMGIESASPHWQELSGKKVDPQLPERIVREARARGILPIFYFMLGFPGETLVELRATLEMARRLKDQGARPCISIVTPYPKTKLWDLCYSSETQDVDFSLFCHQSSNMGFASCTADEWMLLLEEANKVNA